MADDTPNSPPSPSTGQPASPDAERAALDSALRRTRPLGSGEDPTSESRTPIVPPPAIDRASALGATLPATQLLDAPVTELREIYEYRDGPRRTLQGGAVDPSAPARVVKLPFSSSEVAFRLGTYDVLTQLGRGGMGVVYRGYALNLRRFVAIKAIVEGPGTDAVAIARFHNEAVLAARLRHPNIVAVFDSGQLGDVHYLVTEVVEGGNLAQWVGRPGKRVPSDVVPMVITIARALHYAHQRGVVHRDVKPENVLLTLPEGDRAPEPILTDFGIAKALGALDDNPALTTGGSPVGTALYMPPEQVNGELGNLGPHSDVWALGATLYHLMCGLPPFEGVSVVDVLAKVKSAEPTKPSKAAKHVFDREIPPDLETIVLKALEKEASARYASAADFADDLQRFLDGDLIRARPATFAERARKRLRRNRRTLASAFATSALMLVLTGSFAALSLATLARTGRSLEEGSLADTLEEAATIERAVRVNMLQGRADQARTLLRHLSEDGKVMRIEVARTDRVRAFSDPTTRDRVGARVTNPDTVASIGRRHPQLVESIESLKRFAFPNIDAAPKPTSAPESREVSVDRDAWLTALRTRAPQHYEERRDGAPWLVVLRPIESSPECRECHADTDESGYDEAPIRAVLVVRRSQQGLLDAERANEKLAVEIGGGVALGLLALVVFFHRVLGIRPAPEQFGVARARRSNAPSQRSPSMLPDAPKERDRGKS